MKKSIFEIDLIRNLVIISFFLIAVVLLFNFYFDPNFRVIEILASWIISIVNFVFGVKLFMLAFEKPNKQFMIFSLGSIIVRLFLIIVLVIVLITVFKFQKNYFILSFIAFYFIYLFFEIHLLNKYSGKSKG